MSNGYNDPKLPETQTGRRKFEPAPVVPMLVDPCKAQLIGMFDKLDNRGQQAVIACAAFHLRYPKE